MIVRMAQRMIASFPANIFNHPIRNHFIRVHVKRYVCTWIEHIDYKFPIPVSL